MADEPVKAPPKQGSAPKKRAAKAATAKKAAGIVAAGGGPEDPFADAAAAGYVVGKGIRKATAPKGRLTPKNPKQLVMLEFVACFTVLGLGTIVAPSGKPGEGVPHLVVKGSALALLFFILSLIASGGRKAEKVAAGLGALVTAAYLFSSADAANILTWISKYFSPAGTGATEASLASFTSYKAPAGEAAYLNPNYPLGAAPPSSSAAAEGMLV